jgi:hypothetical protein
MNNYSAVRLSNREAMVLGRLPELYLVDAFQVRTSNHAKGTSVLARQVSAA